MTKIRQLTLRTQLLLLVVFIVLAGFAVTLGVLTRQASNLQLHTALQYTEQLAASHGAEAASHLEEALNAARTTAHALASLKAADLPQRSTADALLKGVLASNPAFLSVWTAWEPNAFDGRDSEYANQPGHDASGRYVPAWSHGGPGNSVAVEALAQYDELGAGDYYQLAKRSGQETVLEPYRYNLSGKDVLLTSLAVPIQVNGKVLGVVGVDIALASLQERIGKLSIYETGHASLFSNAGLYVGDQDALKVGQPMGSGSTLAADRAAVQNGQPLTTHYFSTQLNTDVTRVYVPLKIGATKTPWSFAATVPDNKILAEVQRLRWTAAGLGALSILLVSICLAWSLDRLVLRPIGGEPRDAADLARRVAQGDLSRAIAVRPGDTHSLMAQLKAMQDSLAHVVSNVRQGAEGVASASTQISHGNQDLSARTESQASALEETAASMEQLGSTVTQNADSARHANALAREASTVAGQGGAAVARVIETMKEINDSSRRIADIIGVIDSIAFQTNILALNAAVEAARAGDQGRGFAVVASEVRNLAGRSAEAAKEIKTLIGASVDRVEAGSSQVDQAGETMTQVVHAIQRVTDLMGEISAASAEQSAGVNQVGEAVMQMDQATQQNAALVEEMAAAAASLRSQAQELVQSVAVFQLGDQAQVLARKAAPAAVPAPPHQPAPPLAGPARAPRKPLAASLAKAAAPAPSAGAPRKGSDDDWESF